MSFYHLDKEFPAIIRDLNNRIIKQTTIKIKGDIYVYKKVLI